MAHIPKNVLRQWFSNFQNDYQQYFKSKNADSMLNLFCSNDGTQNLAAVNVVGDYSLAPEEFIIQPGADEVYQVARMLVYIQGAGVLGSGKYGPIAALTNGITISYVLNDIETTLTPIPIKTSGQWKMYCYDTDPISFGAGDNLDAARWSFEKSGHYPTLFGLTNDMFKVAVSDNFTGLTLHTFIIQGKVFDLHKE